MGYAGWRYDYVKGYSGSYTKIYNEQTKPYFSVGELWDDLMVAQEKICENEEKFLEMQFSHVSNSGLFQDTRETDMCL